MSLCMDVHRLPGCRNIAPGRYASWLRFVAAVLLLERASSWTKPWVNRHACCWGPLGASLLWNRGKIFLLLPQLIQVVQGVRRQVAAWSKPPRCLWLRPSMRSASRPQLLRRQDRQRAVRGADSRPWAACLAVGDPCMRPTAPLERAGPALSLRSRSSSPPAPLRRVGVLESAATPPRSV